MISVIYPFIHYIEISTLGIKRLMSERIERNYVVMWMGTEVGGRLPGGQEEIENQEVRKVSR